MTDRTSGDLEHVTNISPAEPEKIAFTAPLGGVLTREVGAITGDLEVWIDPDDAEKARVRYAGAEDVYTVKGKTHGRTLEDIIATLSTDPGVDADDNPLSTDLSGS